MTESELQRYSLFESLKEALVMGNILSFILRGGIRTSEFWITMLVLLLPVLDHFVNPVLASHSPELFLWGLAGTVYTFVRGWIKAHATKQISGGAANLTPGGNIETVRTGPGVAAQEAAHAQLAAQPGGMDLTQLQRTP